MTIQAQPVGSGYPNGNVEDADVPTSGTDPLGQTTTSPSPLVGPSTRKLAVIGAGIAVVAGLVGALLSQAIFPAHTGRVGPAGVAGPVGPQGPAGSANNFQAALSKVNVNTSKLGYCFSYNTQTSSDGSTSWMTNATLYPPTDSNGALSCGTGSFISLTPNTPQGPPVVNYNPMVGTTATDTNN